MRKSEDAFFLPFLKKEQLTKDTYSFYFKRTANDPEFTPGQYFEMKLQIKNPDERGTARVFTIASSPTEKEYYMFTTRIIQSSFKLQLNSLNPGETVEFNGPWDDLNFDTNDPQPSVFFAGGIGVTPYHSIVKCCLDKNITTPLVLFVSWKNQDEMVFDDFFRNASELLENFTYVPTLSDDQGLASDLWDGEKGRVNKEMIKKYVDDIARFKYYFSGPPAMVKALKETVVEMGVSKEKLIAEEFEGY